MTLAKAIAVLEAMYTLVHETMISNQHENLQRHSNAHSLVDIMVTCISPVPYIYLFAAVSSLR